MNTNPAATTVAGGNRRAGLERRLIINADDFGRSAEINQAVLRSHREGVLTTASLMVNEPACEQAVAGALENPRLGVGLHLSLLCGRSALPCKQIPGLVNAKGEFGVHPAAVGWRYFFRKELQDSLRREIHEQFRRFRLTGLPLDHVNGHLHMHLHPVVFRILMEDAAELGIEHLRLTFDPFWFNLRLASGRLGYRLLHTLAFCSLTGRARKRLAAANIRHTQRVFGLLQNGYVDEAYFLKLIAALPPGDSELYSHPSLSEFKHEFDALLSQQVKAQLENSQIKLIRYQDL